MRFPPIPIESKSQINKAGEILVKRDLTDKKFEWALDVVERWRACHAYPINTFQSTLRRRLKEYGKNSIAAQRLKRMPTIIHKLDRFPIMPLSTMQDIGGVRAILPSVYGALKLAEEYKVTRFEHELVNVKDYINVPRDEDGYRSIHLIYKYRNKQNPSFDGLKLELQVRSRLQHIWATAVETMGTFLGESLKTRQGSKQWLDFFCIISSAFAYEENSPLVPKFNKFSKEQTFEAVIEAEQKLGALQKMGGLTVAVQEITNTSRSYFYHLIILNSLERTVRVLPYDRDSFQKALDEYNKIEARAAAGEKIEPVLVSAGSAVALRRAYPNFFLDITEFLGAVNQIVHRKK